MKELISHLLMNGYTPECEYINAKLLELFYHLKSNLTQNNAYTQSSLKNNSDFLPQIINYIGNDPYDITIYGREISVESTTGDTVSYKETERNFHYQIWMPVFTERSLSVKVNVVDGCTLVLGGITQNQITTRVDKWPLLGDLPLIGRFFQSRAEVGTRNNMMMFVTARLINTKGVPREQNVEKGIPDFLR